MQKNKLNHNIATKLSQTIDQINQSPQKNNGFGYKDKTASKAKTFRLRIADLNNLVKIVDTINKFENRKHYSESEILRGMIDLVANSKDFKKLLNHIKIANH